MVQKEIEQLLERYNLEVARFYGMEPQKVKITTHDSKKSLDEYYRGHHKKNVALDYLVAYAPSEGIQILSPDIMPKGHELSGKIRFKKVVKHELSHYYYALLKTNGMPNWIDEGLACWIAKQKHSVPTQVSISDLEKYHDNNTGGYSVGKYMVGEIISKFGKKKLFEIIVMDNRETRYTELKKMFDWLK